MIRMIALAFLLLGTVGMVWMFHPSEVDGCAVVRRGDEKGASIRIAEEGAIIVWDPVKKIEHFIRRAAFDTQSPDFGFLVPTPTKPDLHDQVDDELFAAMDEWILPRTVVRERFRYTPLISTFCMNFTCSKPAATKSMEGEKSVRVLGEQEVGGFKAAILEADNTEDLSHWLKDNGYASDPELQSWLVPYVAEKWKITAFKIMKDPKTGGLAKTKPVRMSFATDRPFFPYREPAEKVDTKAYRGERLLRVHCISTVRMEGKLGNDAAWQVRTPWSDQLTDDQRRRVARETGLTDADLPAQAWMTTFEDSASPRPGNGEVFFVPAPDRTAIRPPDIIRYHDTLWIPLDVVLIGFVGVARFVIRRWRRAR